MLTSGCNHLEHDTGMKLKLEKLFLNPEGNAQFGAKLNAAAVSTVTLLQSAF